MYTYRYIRIIGIYRTPSDTRRVPRKLAVISSHLNAMNDVNGATLSLPYNTAPDWLSSQVLCLWHSPSRSFARASSWDRASTRSFYELLVPLERTRDDQPIPLSLLAVDGTCPSVLLLPLYIPLPLFNRFGTERRNSHYRGLTNCRLSSPSTRFRDKQHIRR